LVIGGTGLGLSIVKELVNTMDGVVELESVPGSGSCFSFTIPFEQPESKINETSDVFKAHKPLNELTLLIADDEEINFLYLEILLKNSILRIDHALNGDHAVEMVKNNSYDLILMDIKMPGMDGYEATRILKQNFPLIPIIAQTAYATVEDKEKALLAGCDDFIAKPIKKDILLDIFKKYS
jgi:CheY-like chemotaxis protein